MKTCIAVGAGVVLACVGSVAADDLRLLVTDRGGSGNVLEFSCAASAFAGVFSGGLTDPTDVVVGPDGDVFVTDAAQNAVLRFDARTGNSKGFFVTPGSGGLVSPRGLTFGPNGDLYVSGTSGKSVMRYDGSTGAFVKHVLDAGAIVPGEILFGPDGFIYYYCVTCKAVKKVDESLGAIVAVLCKSVDGAQNGRGFDFGPDGHLYLGSGVNQDSVKKYDGVTGDFIGTFAVGGMDEPYDVEFGPDGRLYVSSSIGGNVVAFDSITGAFVDEPAAKNEGGLTNAGGVAMGPVQCYADCERDGDLDLFDFLCFQGEFASGQVSADCEKDADLDIFDFLCFQGEFAAGCP